MADSFSLLEMARTATTSAAPSASPEPESYERALSELDVLVQKMEGGQLPLDQLLAAYRRGAELLSFCRERLQSVEDQVKVLEDGQLKAWSAS
jgi:exodeoxyribonuclease VII small subunit